MGANFCPKCGKAMRFHAGGSCPGGPVICECVIPKPDAIGECQRCHRKYFRDIYVPGQAAVEIPPAARLTRWSYTWPVDEMDDAG